MGILFICGLGCVLALVLWPCATFASVHFLYTCLLRRISHPSISCVLPLLLYRASGAWSLTSLWASASFPADTFRATKFNEQIGGVSCEKDLLFHGEVPVRSLERTGHCWVAGFLFQCKLSQWRDILWYHVATIPGVLSICL